MRLLADTSIWIEHLKRPKEALFEPMRQKLLFVHPAIIGELAAGQIKGRATVLSDLRLLPRAPEVDFEEVLYFIDHRNLFGRGLSWVDCQLLASAAISNLLVMTNDRTMKVAAKELRLLV